MIAIVWKEFKTFSTSALSMVFHFMTPLFLLVFFATVFSKNLNTYSFGGGEVAYLDFFTPGLAGYVTFMTFMMALTFIRHDRASGVLGIIVLAQGGLGRYIGGKMIAQTIFNLLKVGALICLSLLISGNAVALGKTPNLGAFLIAVLLGTIIWLSLGLTVALILKRDEMREIIVMLVSMPLVFSSSMYYDISHAPAWIRAISMVNPLTYTCNVARQAYLNESVGNVGGDVLVLAVMAVCSVGIALFVSRRSIY